MQFLDCVSSVSNEHDTRGNFTNLTSKQTFVGEYLSIATVIFDIYQYCIYVSKIPLLHTYRTQSSKRPFIMNLIKLLWTNVPAIK